MNDSDWNKLWLLNALASDYCKLSQLVHDPNAESINRGYWLFPSQTYLEASIDDRIKAIDSCLGAGFIAVYGEAWLTAPRFHLDHGRIQGFRVSNAGSLAEFQVVITQEGHKEWEAGFQPDWARYWMTWGSEFDKTSQQETISLLYAGDQILDELLQWFPSLRQYDSSAGMTRLRTFTYFQHQATLWKVLPSVKVTKWRVKNTLEAWNALVQAKVPARLPEEHQDRNAGFGPVRAFIDGMCEESEVAARILLRLSKRW
jgi:hypothetical protein